MGKPPNFSNKKWNKKFQKNVKKFQTLANLSSGSRQNKSDLGDSDARFGLFKKLAFLQCFLSFVILIPQAISNVLVRLSSSFTTFNNRKTVENLTTHLETRVSNLEKTLEEYAGRITALQQEVEDSKMRNHGYSSCKQLESSSQSSVGLNTRIPTFPPPLVQSVAVPSPALVCFTAVAPPPPPPPPPPAGILSIRNNNLLVRKTSAAVKKPSQKFMRPTISIEDITSVKLKKTPSIQRGERVSCFIYGYNSYLFI